MINVFKFFFTALILSYIVVWISDHPGTIKIFWSEYLIETNLLGFFLVFFWTDSIHSTWTQRVFKAEKLTKKLYDCKKE